MAQPLHLTMEGTIPLTMSEWLMDSSLPLGRNLNLENTKLLSEYSNFNLANDFISTSAICLFIATYWSFTAPLCTISLI